MTSFFIRVQILTVLLTVAFCDLARSQGEVVKAVQLDSVMLEAVSRGFSVEDFVELVRKDTTFYKAFKNLHFFPYDIKSDFKAFDKKGKVKATQVRTASQLVKNKRKWIVIEREEVSPKFYKRNDKNRYYTAELMDRIFYKTDTLFASNKVQRSYENMETASNTDKLKVLIFNPGADIPGVPGAGKKLAIFDDRMAPYYDYSISAENYRDSISCYVFSCLLKEMEFFDNGKVVIKNLRTYFDRSNFNIVHRSYDMGYRSILFDFDVSIVVNNRMIKNNILLSDFSYDGYWNIAGKRPEIAQFRMVFDNYRID